METIEIPRYLYLEMLGEIEDLKAATKVTFTPEEKAEYKKSAYVQELLAKLETYKEVRYRYSDLKKTWYKEKASLERKVTKLERELNDSHGITFWKNIAKDRQIRLKVAKQEIKELKLKLNNIEQ